MVMHIKRFSALLFLFPLLLVGCATSSITNLTPAVQPRSSSGTYPVEALWKSNQQSLKPETIRSYVIVGLESFPMQPTPLVSNRWETMIAIPADKSHIYYQFKFDYDYRGMPGNRSGSMLSQEYRLDITD